MAAFSFRKDNHSACAGWQGLGGGAYQQAFAEVINSALLATTIFSSGQRYIFNGLQVCDPCYRGIILLLCALAGIDQVVLFVYLDDLRRRLHRDGTGGHYSN